MIIESARRTNVMGIHTKRAHTGKVLNLHPLNIGNENIDGVLRKYLQESVG
jgi:hypothetical protein